MNNPRFPHRVVIRRVVKGDPFDAAPDDSEGAVIYDGACRSYVRTVSTRTGKGDVLTDMRVLAVPVRRDEWADMPVEGDYLEVSIGCVTEYGHVTDKLPNNFGTDVVWKYVRN
jgi:hypothetical protein